tara:strand:- start:3469 stop:3669 length:201 start_codon:yes stop_codon:yes gene_type:complete
MADTEKEKRYKRNAKNSVLLIISVVLVINTIKIIENEKNKIEIIILKKSEKYDKREIEEVLKTALR